MKQPVRNAFRIARALIDGETVTSHRVAQILGIEEPAGRKYVDQAIDVLGAKEVRDGGRNRAARLEMVRLRPPSREVAMAAGFASSLATLFDGSAIAGGLRGVVQYVLRAAPNPKRFEYLERGECQGSCRAFRHAAAA